MTITIYHNPRCSKSRATLAILEQTGKAFEIVEYLKSPPDAATLKGIARKLGLGPDAFIREGEAAYKDLGLYGADDDALYKAMAAHPILIERPIVVNGERAAIGRPPEAVLDIL
ncbi:MAG: arsenate reductase (glutaredoxin) [Parvularculaceae bacterium]